MTSFAFFDFLADDDGVACDFFVEPDIRAFFGGDDSVLGFFFFAGPVDFAAEDGFGGRGRGFFWGEDEAVLLAFFLLTTMEAVPLGEIAADDEATEDPREAEEAVDCPVRWTEEPPPSLAMSSSLLPLSFVLCCLVDALVVDALVVDCNSSSDDGIDASFAFFLGFRWGLNFPPLPTRAARLPPFLSPFAGGVMVASSSSVLA